MPDDQPTESWFRRFAKREPLIVRAVVSAAVLLVAAGAARWFDVDLDTDATIAVLLGWLGLTGAVIREGVSSPATVEKEKQRAADEALMSAPIAQATVVQVGEPDTATDTDRVVPRYPPAPPAPPVEQTGERGRAGLFEPDDAGHDR